MAAAAHTRLKFDADDASADDETVVTEELRAECKLKLSAMMASQHDGCPAYPINNACPMQEERAAHVFASSEPEAESGAAAVRTLFYSSSASEV